ncbi:MAG: hypothetical protein A2X35_09715 [Elusimicrobia bacterium GWA2_61_42]|nr:MAG: hypothetical protein A2X35_09715 [Elusimicrobia bacterium GWA2_61_42]OGR76453.1 MAG: hypothetical protein A2X38_12290 [Elusimicrobia bacterium GWC2_61_25]
MRQRPARKMVRLVLMLRGAWLVPVSLMALAYAGYTLYTLGHLMRYPAGSAVPEFLEALLGAGLGAAFLFFTWRMWKKTWDLMLDRIYPEPSAVLWQAAWIVLAVILPGLVIWPKVQHLLLYAGEGANKGGLSQLKAAVADYRAAKGAYPAALEELERSGVIKKLPALWDKRGAGFPHKPSSAAAVYKTAAPRDSGDWAYVAAKDKAPLVFIDCTHKDSRGNPWSAY